MPAPEAAIVIERLRKVFADGTVALDDVSVTIPAGEIVAILGRSGAGKSTLLRCACRLIEPTSGTVRIDGVDITAAKGRELSRARAHVGFVFQQFNLVRSYRVIDNVLMARIAHVPYWRGLLGAFTARDREIAQKCLAQVGMAEKSLSLARDLSGGQQQRVAVARAFAQQPRALFADEPTASLDPKLAETVLTMLRAYGRTEGVPVLLNVHTIEHARRFADRVIGVRKGALVHDGPAASLTDEDVQRIYADDTAAEAASVVTPGGAR